MLLRLMKPRKSMKIGGEVLSSDSLYLVRCNTCGKEGIDCGRHATRGKFYHYCAPVKAEVDHPSDPTPQDIAGELIYDGGSAAGVADVVEAPKPKRHRRVKREKQGPAVPKAADIWEALYLAKQGQARDREKQWGLTLEQVKSLATLPCVYCGAEPSGRFRWRGEALCYSGLDRVNNARGYEPGNVVPCCGECNMWKRSGTIGEMLQRARKILGREGVIAIVCGE